MTITTVGIEFERSHHNDRRDALYLSVGGPPEPATASETMEGNNGERVTPESAESVVLLHGFGGTRRTWDGVVALLPRERYTPLALDLPGHGEGADAARPIGFSGCVEHVLARSPERFVLGGYSVGGRIALHVALAAPERVARLVLVSCTAGIEDAGERAARQAADRALADDLEHGPFEEFIARWRRQPVFAGEPPQAGDLAREDWRRNRPEALAAALRGLGTGEMEPLWDRLGGLAMSVAVVVGERDEKFRALGERMVGLLPRGELVVLAGGHALALENPAGIARALGLPGRPKVPSGGSV